MTESTRPPNDPEQMALDEVFELWADARPTAETKERGLEILNKIKVTPTIHEDEAYDVNNVGAWFLGQVYKAIETERIDELGYLMSHVERYSSKDFFGKRMHDVFDNAKGHSNLERKVFENLHPSNEDWLDSSTEPHKSAFFELDFDKEVFEGRKFALLVKGEAPDLPYKRIEGDLVVKPRDIGSNMFHIKTDNGLLEIGFYDVVEYRVKDASEPKYNQIQKIIKREFDEIIIEDNLLKGEKVSWLRPNVASGTWDFVEAVVVEPKHGDNPNIIVDVDGKSHELNFNMFRSEGNRIYSKRSK